MKDSPHFCEVRLTKERPLALMRDNHEMPKGGTA